jgi:hypothetical protein
VTKNPVTSTMAMYEKEHWISLDEDKIAAATASTFLFFSLNEWKHQFVTYKPC